MGDSRLIFLTKELHLYGIWKVIADWKGKSTSRWRRWIQVVTHWPHRCIWSRRFCYQQIRAAASRVEKEAPKGCLVHQPARLCLFSATLFSCVVARVLRTAELTLFCFHPQSPTLPSSRSRGSYQVEWITSMEKGDRGIIEPLLVDFLLLENMSAESVR